MRSLFYLFYVSSSLTSCLTTTNYNNLTSFPWVTIRRSCGRRRKLNDLLFGVTDRTGLTDNRNLHLSRIGHFVLNLLGNVVRKIISLLVGDLFAAYDNPKLPTGLDCIGRAPEMASHT